MNFHPGILALLVNSLLSSVLICFCCYQGLRIIRHWNLSSGAEYQLDLERKTYLISTIMMYLMGFQFLSFFLFIYTTDCLSPLFTGAMCAAGTLNINSFGYPALFFKLILCLVAGIWLIINFTDNTAPDYPLIRKKYWLLLLIAPFMLLETVTLALYFLNLDPDIITSCCSVIFSEKAENTASRLLSLPGNVSKALFFLSAASVILLAILVMRRSKGAVLLTIAALIHLPISIFALIDFISVYIYELPTHHCPFCILQREYFFIGYFLYLTALLSAVFGGGAGLINSFSRISSLTVTVPRIQKKLALMAMLSTLSFLTLSTLAIFFSNLRM